MVHLLGSISAQTILVCGINKLLVLFFTMRRILNIACITYLKDIPFVLIKSRVSSKSNRIY